jgi:hypothetical protein
MYVYGYLYPLHPKELSIDVINVGSFSNLLKDFLCSHTGIVWVVSVQTPECWIRKTGWNGFEMELVFAQTLIIMKHEEQKLW